MSDPRAAVVAELTQHAAAAAVLRIQTLFANDGRRAADFSIEAAGITLDYSKQRLTRDARQSLVRLAHASGLAARIEAMFNGAPINRTEHRAVLHCALRGHAHESLSVDGVPIAASVRAARTQMETIVTALRDQTWRGFSGAAITDIVHIGIGGSYLGPALACGALADPKPGPLRVQFVANVDGSDIASKLAVLDPARTLFIVASKSFTTPETALNARTAEAWLRAAGASHAALAQHFIAITARPALAHEFGIAPANCLPLWDWVGGRYSLWSAIGLPVALAIGMGGFEALLRGAAALDHHFRTADFAHNLPVLLALVGIWNNNSLGAESLAVIPYDERLALLPSYLQQLDMESNGKRVDLDGNLVAGATAPIVWGGTGTNVQHAFFQLLHQGTRQIPVDFILSLHNPHAPLGHHDMLVANCLAQAEALMTGRKIEPSEGIAPHRACPGNQASNLLLLDELTPTTLGALLALYEHKTFVQGVIWNINSFDQWGVELGKVLAESLLSEMSSGVIGAHDGSTAAALGRYLRSRK